MELLTFLENDDLENFNENMSISAVEEKDSKGFTILHLAVQREKYDFSVLQLFMWNFFF